MVPSLGSRPIPRRRATIDGSIPIPNYTERCFEHDVITEDDGTVPVAVVNRRIALGVYQPTAQLPHQTTWRMLVKTLYVVAIEASTDRDAGRWDARARPNSSARAG